VLVLAYHFPPVGGGGVQRSVKFVRYLPDFGYQPIVVTGEGASHGRWTPPDPSLAAEIPPSVRVCRVGREPAQATARRRRLERWLSIESRFARWWIGGAVGAGQTCGDVDLVYASMAPYETATAAAELARILRRPWVADLRDPWALDEMAVYPSRFHRGRETRRMDAALSSAAAVVMNTPEAAEQLLHSFPALAGKPLATIPNGFDASDFRSRPTADPVDGVFRIVHAGSLHAELGRRHRRSRTVRRLLGGTLLEADLLPRSHVHLLDAVERVLARRNHGGTPIEVHLAGVLSKSDRELAELPFVRAHGYLSHLDAVALLQSADLLFLPMHDLPPGTRARIVPAKTYEYLASGRPVLAAVPDGDARDLLSEAETVELCRPADVAAMQRIIASKVDQVRRGGRAPTQPPALAQRYERRELTRQLAAALDAAIESAGLPPARRRAAVLAN
jgi:glycosyltransferase involved in cell wall biosynthesis